MSRVTEIQEREPDEHGIRYKVGDIASEFLCPCCGHGSLECGPEQCSVESEISEHWECDHCGACFWMNYCRFLKEIVVQRREETVDEDITIDISIDTNTFGEILSIRKDAE